VLSIPLILCFLVCFCIIYYGCRAERKRAKELRLHRALQQLALYNMNQTRYCSSNNLADTDLNSNHVSLNMTNETNRNDQFKNSMIKTIISSNITLFDEKLPTYHEVSTNVSNNKNTFLKP
jgi:hypothetical protein